MNQTRKFFSPFAWFLTWWWRYFLSQGPSFLAFLFWISVVVTVPFLDKFDTYASRAFFYRAASVSYPRTDDARVAVVLATDASLRGEVTYPLPYSFHAAVLTALAKQSPKAVLIDFTFPDERPDAGLPALTSAIRNLHSAGTLVYLGVNEQSDGQPIRMRGALQTLAGENIIQPVRISFKRDKNFAVYRLEPDKSGVLPFAVQAYNDLCFRGTLRHCQPVHDQGYLDVWWGAPPLPSMCRYGDAIEQCSRISSNWVWRAIKLSLSDVIPATHRELDPIPIPYHTTVDPADLVEEKVYPSLLADLRQSIVIYGADFLGASDRVASEVYGPSDDDRRAPGASFHAMAIDNLITLNGRFIRAYEDSKWYRMGSAAKPIILAYLLLVACQILYRRYRDRLEPYPKKLTFWRHHTFFILFSSVWAIGSFFCFQGSPSGLFVPIMASCSVSGASELLVKIRESRAFRRFYPGVRKGRFSPP